MQCHTSRFRGLRRAKKYRKRNDRQTHWKHAELREQIDGKVAHDFLLVEQPEA